jgi:hypothetical protein
VVAWLADQRDLMAFMQPSNQPVVA